MISSLAPALAGRLRNCAGLRPLYQTAGIARKTATGDIKRTPSNQVSAEARRPQHHLALPAASRRTGGDEKHYWLAAVADIIHSASFLVCAPEHRRRP